MITKSKPAIEEEERPAMNLTKLGKDFLKELLRFLSPTEAVRLIFSSKSIWSLLRNSEICGKANEHNQAYITAKRRRDSLSSCVDLRNVSFDISRNLLKSLLPMTMLNICWEPLDKFDLDKIASQQDSLRQLHISMPENNKASLKMLNLKNISQFCEMRALILDDNLIPWDLEADNPGPVHRYRNWEYFQDEGYRMTFPIDSLIQLKKLIQLSIPGNLLSGEMLEKVAEMSNLEVVCLRNSSSIKICRCFSKMSNLRVLDVSGGSHLHDLCGLESCSLLEEVNVRNCNELKRINAIFQCPRLNTFGWPSPVSINFRNQQEAPGYSSCPVIAQAAIDDSDVVRLREKLYQM